MVSKWIRQRQIISVPTDHDWWASHAQLPTILKISPSSWRIFVAGRDARNKGSIIAVDVDPTNDMAVTATSQERLINHGASGQFDCDGIGVTSVLEHGGQHRFVSAGMNASCGKNYQIGIGLLASADLGHSFERKSDGPILGLSPDNPHGCSSGQALLINGIWHIWFVSWREWTKPSKGLSEPRYDIRHATSVDAINWKQDAEPAIALADESEGGLARPWVVPCANGYEMWFSVRGRIDSNDPTACRYRIGYATSKDAIHWNRMDDAHSFTTSPEPSDWDFEMQCYASVVDKMMNPICSIVKTTSDATE